MGINGISAGAMPVYRSKERNKYIAQNEFIKRMAKSTVKAGEQISLHNAGLRMNTGSSVQDAYRMSFVQGTSHVKTAYETYRSENYKIIPDNESGCFDIYNRQGERIGAFDYADIKIRQDFATGKQFLISEHGTMSYDAAVLDGELKDALQKVMGKEELETETLQGFTLHTHAGTGIPFLIRDGEEGRGGKVLLQSEADVAKYEALAQNYLSKYPNLVHDEDAARIWADLEIKGLAQRTERGIVQMGYDGISYHDNSDDKNHWSVFFSGNTYKALYEYIQNHRLSMEDMQKFSMWQDIFDSIGSRYERIWP